jgi:exodeoxyribonuclease VII large subunit
MEERKIFSLTQLNAALERHFMNEFGAKTYWITAEIAQVNYKSGNMYLELVDTVDGVKSAQSMANMWAAQVKSVKLKIGSDFDSIVKAGNKLLLLVKIEYHKVYGLKLNVLDIDPNYAYGEIEREKKLTIERLKSEGVFDLQKYIQIPILAKRIALIGSPQTSGFRDFCDTLTTNNAYRNFKIKYFPSSVQGDTAVSELVKAIHSAQEYDVDVIVLVRGGGSKMDLHLFNQYEVCKAICESKIPVITGIGHESDEVVSDLVACQKTITPTACAKFIYLRIYNYLKDLNEAYQALKAAAFFQVSNAMEEFQHYNNYFVLHARQLLSAARERLQQQSHDIQSSFMRTITTERMELELQLDRAEGYAKNEMRRNLEVELVARLERTEWLSKGILDNAALELKNLTELLVLLNPEKLLKSGYTVSTIENEDVMRYSGNPIGKELKTLAAGMLLTSTITEIKKYHE